MTCSGATAPATHGCPVTARRTHSCASAVFRVELGAAIRVGSLLICTALSVLYNAGTRQRQLSPPDRQVHTTGEVMFFGTRSENPPVIDHPPTVARKAANDGKNWPTSIDLLTISTATVVAENLDKYAINLGIVQGTLTQLKPLPTDDSPTSFLHQDIYDPTPA